MKRIVSVLLALVLLVSALPAQAAHADSDRYMVGDFLYSHGFWSYKGAGGDVVIPDGVEEINKSLFNEFRGDIDTLYIPGTVKRIVALVGPKSIKTIEFETGDVEIDQYTVIVKPKNGIKAPEGSKAWQYAKDKGYFVTSAGEPCFERDTIYLLKGDWLYSTFLNQTVMNYDGEVKWSVSSKKILKKKSVIMLDGTDTGRKEYKAVKTGKTKVTATLEDGSKISYKLVVLKKTVENRLLCLKNQCDGMTEKEKASYLAKWLHTNVVYDNAAAYPYVVDDETIKAYGYSSRTDSRMYEASTAYGSLVKLQAKCDGISTGYLMAAQAVGLDCITILGTLTGEAHAWNMVCVDSYWYYVDATNVDTVKPSLGKHYDFDRDSIEKTHPTI